MNKKWSSEKVKEVQRWLKKRWPESFAPGPDLRPLSLQVHKEVLQHREEYPQLSGRVVREVLKRHTTSYGYLYGLVKNNKRYDLNGNAVGEVAPEHREWARAALKAKQKEAQRIRKEARQLLRQQRRASSGAGPLAESKAPLRSRVLGNKGLGNNGLGNKAEPGARSGDPVIRYKQTKRRMIKPPTETAVDLAS